MDNYVKAAMGSVQNVQDPYNLHSNENEPINMLNLAQNLGLREEHRTAVSCPHPQLFPKYFGSESKTCMQ